MDIKDLRCALETLDTGSFARAAQRLYVSRQALSQTVKRLETQLGTPLFAVQGNNRLVPTPEGSVLLEDARTVVEAFDAFLERHGLELPASKRPQALSLALATGAALSLSFDPFAEFRLACPHVAQEVEETNTDGALALVDDGSADLALVGSHPIYLERYDYSCIVPTGLWLAVPRTNPLSQRSHLTPHDLDGQTVVTAGKLNHLHRYLLTICDQADAHPSIPTTASNPDMLVQMARECGGLFFTFPASIRPEGDRRDVAVLPLETPESRKFGTYMVRRLDVRPHPAASEFWDYLKRKTAKK